MMYDYSTKMHGYTKTHCTSYKQQINIHQTLEALQQYAYCPYPNLIPIFQEHHFNTSLVPS